MIEIRNQNPERESRPPAIDFSRRQPYLTFRALKAWAALSLELEKEPVAGPAGPEEIDHAA